ncbi:DUF1648 domain-containing protein [Aquimarina sp. 2201CG14-23]|uniref:DUF1648 domain-containing protein n=1 Tax=Aquimarina mycalae TaxID=3040073 RepID=UPI0024780B76|nr:DUF1648 domain-containing protein [Aquimarina sp. 2201CG14-23]MDH7444622.1 DUF1648 domain-containing protein [Aquimarina sp. 2201CG14-23]
MNNPVIKLEKQTIDLMLEAFVFIGVSILVILPIYYFKELPEMIPTHFNGKGQPDAYNSKSMIWTLPVIGLVLCVGLYVLNRYPHVFNYPTKITIDNAVSYYRNATRLIRVLNLIIAWAFVFIMWKSIKVALKTSEGLGTWFLPVFIILMIGVIIYFVLKSNKR